MVAKDKEKLNSTSTTWIRLTYSAIVGTVVAAILGYGLSLAFSLFGLALVAPTDGVRPHSALFLERSGLNFLAIHHIKIIGSSLAGEATKANVSIVWPITLWAIIPALALIIGGFTCRKLTNVRQGTFAMGAALAVPYTLVLLIGRAFLSVPSTAVKLPQLPLQGLTVDPSILPTIFNASALSIVLHGLIFGMIFGGLGSLGLKGIRKGLTQKNAFWPSWARGAVLALVLGQTILLVLIAAFALGSTHAKNREWTSASLISEEAGLAHYFSHGVTLRGGIESKVGIPEAQPTSESFRAGMLQGTEANGKKKPVKPIAYTALLIPALACLIGGRFAAKKSEKIRPKWQLAASFAASYALLMSAIVGLYTLVISTATSFEGIATTASIAVGPSAAEAFAFSLAISFIFGFIGIGTCRTNVNS